ncbi:MAG: tRNA (adenosine(37)-N6)-threonylcarbamoyltransferase complex transferase subunit TsaD [Candidatus Nomurabacteria bacterium]|nr:tRNA (adenosine(37)-N6)-threonylcarbamoyltransferase complex transferase subunit TsaD [Candidatus Nomurabacteria bacterium]
MTILGIETSCDETAASIVKNGTQILSNIVVSQIDIHATYGGVVPEIAARSHIEAILPVIHQALSEANLTWANLDAIAVTHTPGLLGSLLIGTLAARTLSILHNIPIYPIHHLKSHIYANWLGKEKLPEFPLIALVVSGGHTQLIHMTNHNHFEIIGTTRDDAIGEVFDKIAKILGLPYPGGPSIASAALKGNPEAYKLPIPKVANYDFSFSGLKTAVLRAVQKDLSLPISTPSSTLAAKLTNKQINDFAASFQKTAIEALTKKTQKALQAYHPKSLILAGGVSANALLRQEMIHLASGKAQHGLSGEHLQSEKKLPVNSFFPATKSIARQPMLFFPQPNLCTDNAAMVASAAHFSIKSGQKPTDPYDLDISPRSPIN